MRWSHFDTAVSYSFYGGFNHTIIFKLKQSKTFITLILLAGLMLYYLRFKKTFTTDL